MLFFIQLKTRKVIIAGITAHPNDNWMAQTARNFTCWDGELENAKYLIHDHGTKYSTQFDAIMQTSGIKPLKLPAMSPGGVEHAQGEVKRELDIQSRQFELPDTFPYAVKQAVHNVNHNPRPVALNGNCSCGIWMLHMSVRFSKRYRSEVYQQIKALAIEMSKGVHYSYKEMVISECWRKAVKQWLISNEHITITTK